MAMCSRSFSCDCGGFARPERLAAQSCLLAVPQWSAHPLQRPGFPHALWLALAAEFRGMSWGGDAKTA
eukprot:2676510-Pyramimonas_sp.AAC.1